MFIRKSIANTRQLVSNEASCPTIIVKESACSMRINKLVAIDTLTVPPKLALDATLIVSQI